MNGSFFRFITAALICVAFIAGIPRARAALVLPEPKSDTAAAFTDAEGTQTVVFAGGCFWGMQAVFEHVRGVRAVLAGYTGGAADTAEYEKVSTGTTGHAESVEVIYRPRQISFGKLMQIFFAVAHDPTQVGGQGPDKGDQYRSEIYYTIPDQQKMAEAYLKQLQDEKVFSSPITTKIEPLKTFYPAEDYHQDFYKLHPDNPYIVVNDLPKVQNLKQQYPDFYTEGSSK